MIKKNPSLKTNKNPFSFSVRTILLIMLFLVSFIPVASILPSLSGGVWDSLYKDTLKTNKLLAASLVEPINLKLEAYQHELELLDIKLQTASFQNSKEIINKFNNSYDNVIAVSLLLLSKPNDPVIAVNDSYKGLQKEKAKTPAYISKEFKYLRYDQKNSISHIFKSAFSQSPIILIRHQLIDSKFKKIGTLFAEIEPKFIQKLCNNISFGNKGHCIVVDNKSRVIAHPNKAWVSQIHSLSSHKLAQACKTSNIGSLEYTSIDNIDMLGAFAKVQGLNWGVLITRPKDEISTPLTTFINDTFQWLIIGLAISLLIAILTTIKVTQPLSTLSLKSKLLSQKLNTYSLGNIPKNSPKDIKRIWETLAKLLSEYQELNRNNTILESSSKKDIRKVMNNLRKQNIKKRDNIDTVTGLTKLSCFTEEIRKSLLLYKGEIAGLIILEIDNYEPLIAKGKEDLATLILKHVAHILNNSKRSDDMVAHYGDKGRFAIFINDCSAQALEGMAKKLHSLIEINPLHVKDDSVYINISIGITARKIDAETTTDSMIALAENALENTKTAENNSKTT